MPQFSTTKRNCKLCYAREKKDLKVFSFCSAQQCNVYLHCTAERNCFKSGTRKAMHTDETCLFIAYFMSEISLCFCCPIGLLMGIDLCLFV